MAIYPVTFETDAGDVELQAPDDRYLLDVAVEIPMVGSGASLNVAVAGSLVRYRLAGLI